LTGEQRALAARNLGLVGVHLKRNVPRSGPPTRSRERDDLFQEGCLALVRAARTYDPVEHGGSFAAYALPRIRSAVHWALHEYFPTIRVPVRVNRAKGERGGCGFADRPPVAEELSYEIARDLPARSPVCEGEVTIWHAVRERYRRAVRLAVAEVQAGVRRGKNAAKIVEAVAEERLLISRPERQTSLRAMARRLGTHKSRVMAHENRLRSSVRRHFAADPQLPVLIRLARRDPEGFAGRLDREKRRELRRAEVQCFAGQFADLSRSAKADLVYRMIEQTVPAVTEMACNLYRLTNSPEPLSVDRVA